MRLMLLGDGPSLGLLTAVGYLAFAAGAGLLWRNRGEMREWLRLEFGAFHTEIFRRDIPTKWSTLRENDCLSFAVPAAGPVGPASHPSLRPTRHLQIVCGAGLVFLGQLLFLLAFMS